MPKRVVINPSTGESRVEEFTDEEAEQVAELPDVDPPVPDPLGVLLDELAGAQTLEQVRGAAARARDARAPR